MRSHLGKERVNRNARLLWKVYFTLLELTLSDNGEYFALFKKVFLLQCSQPSIVNNVKSENDLLSFQCC